MTEEEYFRKNYPDSCYGDRLLSPYWDFFQDGVEFGERQSEKKIEELKKENAKLRAKYLQATDEGTSFAHLKSLERENAKLKKTVLKMNQVITETFRNLTKAKGLLRAWFQYCIDTEGKTPLKIETAQFLEEIEK